MSPIHYNHKPGFALIAILYLLYFNPVPASATHLAGAEISYRHLSGGNYLLRCVYYRDCFGIAAPPSVIVNANSVSCNISTTYTLQSIQGQGTNITLLCPNATTVCNGGTAAAFEKWVYEDTVLLQGQCADWIFSNTDCCRSAVLTTVSGGSTDNTYIMARLNNLNADNNSAQFTNDPIPFIDINQDFHYNNGMYDADGDSLAYHLSCALTGPSTCVTYMPGYNAQQPFSSVPPVTFDYFTGDLLMHPIATEIGVIAYEVFEYRNGELVGSVMRDMIMFITALPNSPPTLTGMNGTFQQILYVFPNDTVCFDIFSDDVDPLDTLTMTWNQVIGAATFTTAGTPHPTGTFCWTPTLNDVRPQPYMFTALIRDNTCDLNQAGVYSYFIYVTLDSSLVFMNTNDRPAILSLVVSPNPSNGIFTIQSKEKFERLHVYNQAGACILQGVFENSVDLSVEPPGIYFLEAIGADGKKTHFKIIRI